MKNMKDLGGTNDAGMDAVLQDIKDKSIPLIRNNPEADVALLDILTKHIVAPSPADDAVERAMDEIRSLVEKKVRP